MPASVITRRGSIEISSWSISMRVGPGDDWHIDLAASRSPDPPRDRVSYPTSSCCIPVHEPQVARAQRSVEAIQVQHMSTTTCFMSCRASIEGEDLKLLRLDIVERDLEVPRGGMMRRLKFTRVSNSMDGSDAGHMGRLPKLLLICPSFRRHPVKEHEPQSKIAYAPA